MRDEGMKTHSGVMKHDEWYLFVRSLRWHRLNHFSGDKVPGEVEAWMEFGRR